MQFTLWCIARSPLMFGGEVMALANDTFTLDLLTNALALSVNAQSGNNRELASSEYDAQGNPIVIKWAAEQDDGRQYFVAFFNVKGGDARSMNATLAEISMDSNLKNCSSTNVWTGENAKYDDEIIVNVASQDVVFLYLDAC